MTTRRVTHCRHCWKPMHHHLLAMVRGRCPSPLGFGEPMTAEDQAVMDELVAEEQAANARTPSPESAVPNPTSLYRREPSE